MTSLSSCFHAVPMTYGTFQNSSMVQEGRLNSQTGNPVSSINLVKGPCVSEAAVPDFIHDLLGVGLVLTVWPRSNGQDSSPSDTLLMLLGKLPLASSEELARPSAFTAEGTRSNLKWVSQLERPWVEHPISQRHTSVQAACRRLSVQLTLNRKWSNAWTISCAIVSSRCP